MIALYFSLAFAITWCLDLPALLAAWGVLEGPPDRFMNLVGLGAFGPMLAAMIVARVERSGVKSLVSPLLTWRVDAKWYLAALVLPGGIFVVAAALYNALGHHEPLFYPPNNAAYAAAAIVFPIGEEIGWRGFALPRLLEKMGALRASVVVGVLWTLWHIPMLTLQGAGPWLYAIFIPFMVGGSVLFTWIYRGTRGSLLLAVLTHVGTHLNNPGHAMPGRVVPMLLHAAAYVALALVLVLLDRKAWFAGPQARRHGVRELGFG
jgi:membrane protease YdiL (CAAX protease family)